MDADSLICTGSEGYEPSRILNPPAALFNLLLVDPAGFEPTYSANRAGASPFGHESVYYSLSITTF